MIICKRCQSKQIRKSGIARGKQRYNCKSCNMHFVLGDERVNPETAVKRAFAVILYSLGKASYGFIAKLFGVTRACVLKWLRKEGALLKEPKVSSKIKEIEFDEMWHFVGSKKTKFGSSKRWIVLLEEQLPGFLAIAMPQRSNSSITKSVT